MMPWGIPLRACSEKLQVSEGQGHILTDTYDMGGQDDNRRVDLSINWAHAVVLGTNKEKYYLPVVAHIVEFTWGIPTKDRELPEVDLQQFLDLCRLSPSSIQHDNTTEFARSESFQTWAVSANTILCPVAREPFEFPRSMCSALEGKQHDDSRHGQCSIGIGPATTG
jgi:hypothetical protein